MLANEHKWLATQADALRIAENYYPIVRPDGPKLSVYMDRLAAMLGDCMLHHALRNLSMCIDEAEWEETNA